MNVQVSTNGKAQDMQSSLFDPYEPQKQQQELNDEDHEEALRIMGTPQSPPMSPMISKQLVPYYSPPALQGGETPPNWVEAPPDLFALEQCETVDSSSSTVSSFESETMIVKNDCPADIVASQERAMNEIKRQSHSSAPINHESHDHLKVPKSSNPTGSDAVHPYKKQMKQDRHLKMAIGGVGGAIFGTLIGGPIGLVFITPLAIYGSNKISKKGEKRAQRRWEKASVQRGANASLTAHAGAFA
jgi:hypothetical protein